MSWLFSRALAADYFRAVFTGDHGEQFVRSRLTRMPPAHWYTDKTTDHCPPSLYGMTSAPSTVSNGWELLTWFREDFLAKTSRPLATAPESTESDRGSGPRWRGSFAKYDPGSRSWKTPQLSLVEGSTEFSGTWPTWGWMRDGECYAHPMLERITGAQESGLWPTPYGFQAGNGPDGNEYSTFVRKWAASHPSPTVNCGMTSAAELCLNPSFVESQMGWPTEWTDLKPLPTDRFQQWQQRHGGS
jgi:hypothetical protein